MQPAQRTVRREVARDAVRQRKAWDCGMGCDAFRLMLVQRNRLRCSARQILLRTTAKAVGVWSTPIAAHDGATERRGPQQKQQPSTEGVGRNNQSSSALRGSQFFRFGVLTIRNQLHSGLWPGHQGKRAPPQNGPGLFFPALPRLIALVGNEWAPGSLGKQPAAHFPSPCSAGYPGRSREWLRPRLFGGSPRQFSGACRNHHTLFPVRGTAAASKEQPCPRSTEGGAGEPRIRAGALPFVGLRSLAVESWPAA
jgi:hypothetical protein